MSPRQTRILHRQIDTGGVLPVAVGGEGVEIIDSSGKRYIDGSSGAAVSCLGHGHPAVTAAIKAQVDRLAYAHTSFFTTEIAERLADNLIASAPAGLDHVYYVSGGSEAMEAALKMARQYFVEKGQPQRRHFIARRQSYHGNTLGVLAVGGNAMRRQQFAPLLFDVQHVSPPYAYRDQHDGESQVAYGERLAGELEATIAALGPQTVIAFVARLKHDIDDLAHRFEHLEEDVDDLLPRDRRHYDGDLDAGVFITVFVVTEARLRDDL